MIDIIEKTIEYYLSRRAAPKLEELWVTDPNVTEKKGSVFVTLYLNWEIHGSAGNIKPIEENIGTEIIEATIAALTQDDRFTPITPNDTEKLKLRLDIVESEVILVKEKELENLEPKKLWVIAIKKDYTKLATILPNISNTLLFGKDYPAMLWKKLGESFVFKDYIVYKLETTTQTNF